MGKCNSRQEMQMTNKRIQSCSSLIQRKEINCAYQIGKKIFKDSGLGSVGKQTLLLLMEL